MIPTYRAHPSERKRLSQRPQFAGLKASPILYDRESSLPSQPGIYTYDVAASRPQFSPSSDAPVCPYCREPMAFVAPQGLNRVVWVADDPQLPRPALVVPVPDTHQAVACKPCKQVFTVPR